MSQHAFKDYGQTLPASVDHAGLAQDLELCRRAGRHPSRIATTRSAAFMAGLLPSPRANPRHNCERMTPELPRAPISAPCATACTTSAMEEASGSLATSSQADCIVRHMLVPVSPSGIGKTLSELTVT